MELAHRPYLLFLITQNLTALEDLAREGEHVSAADVYQTVLDEWLRRDTGKHEIPKNIKINFMEELAFRLWNENIKQIHFEELRDWLQEQMRLKLSAVSLTDFERADYDLRTATFLSRDGDGNYKFLHTSFQEFFLGRRITKRLSQQEKEVLDLPKLPQETINFVVELAHNRKSNAEKCAFAIQQILEEGYDQRISENALSICVKWQTALPESAPQPNRLALSGADLESARLEKCSFEDVDFSNANLTLAKMTGSYFRGVFKGCDFSETDMRDADLSHCNFSRAQFNGSDLAGAKLAEANFSGCTIRSAYFQRADMKGSILKNATLQLTRLAWTSLTSSQIKSSILEQCSLPENRDAEN